MFILKVRDYLLAEGDLGESMICILWRVLADTEKLVNVVR